MARDMKKAQENYRRKFYGQNDDQGAGFTLCEMRQIEEAASCKGEAAIMGLEAGFWAGYQYAKKKGLV